MSVFESVNAMIGGIGCGVTLPEVRGYVVFCIQQNESSAVNCQSRRLAQFVVRVII